MSDKYAKKKGIQKRWGEHKKSVSLEGRNYLCVSRNIDKIKMQHLYDQAFDGTYVIISYLVL